MELWSSDLFDRESSPSLEGTFSQLEAGLETLWTHVLDEGVLDDGRPTFVDFQLRVGGRAAITIPRDPSRNPELARLRAVRKQPGFAARLAAIHCAQLGRPFDFAPFLAATPG